MSTWFGRWCGFRVALSRCVLVEDRPSTLDLGLKSKAVLADLPHMSQVIGRSFNIRPMGV